MLSVALFMTLLLMLDAVLFRIQYSFGGIKYFDDFNKTLPFVQCKTGSYFFNFTIGFNSNISIFNNNYLWNKNG
uniref:Candidate secreted effector n=1 Tax=Meloidogyne incognita TaxID=6306 RepID=A0A914M0T3_MELIC